MVKILDGAYNIGSGTSYLPTIAAGVGGAVLGAATVGTVAAIINKRRKKRSSRKTKRIRKKSYRRSRKNRRRRTPRTAGKRRDTSHKRIRYTKKGQPYVILRNGRARFIKMKSAKSSHKRKGGKY